MVKMSQFKYPDHLFMVGGLSDENLFQENRLTHIVYPLLTIHTMNDLDKLFACAEKWLIHQGVVFVSFAPSLATFPVKKLINYVPSNYFRNKFTYTLEIDNALRMVEKIQSVDHQTRTNLQTLHAHSFNSIVEHAGQHNFIHRATTPLSSLPMVNMLVFEKVA
jgi:hypothetical protein